MAEAPETTTRERLVAVTGGLVTATLLGWALLQPLFRFVNPVVPTVAAPFLMIGIFVGYNRYVFGGPKRFDLLEAMALLFGLSVLVLGLGDAYRVSQINDTHCQALEREMFQPNAHRGEAAAVFSALGCRPLEGTIVANGWYTRRWEHAPLQVARSDRRLGMGW